MNRPQLFGPPSFFRFSVMLVVAGFSVCASAQQDSTLAAKRLGLAGAIAHPSADMVRNLVPDAAIGGIAGTVPIPDPPLLSGVYVNFESPPTQPLAYDAASRALAIANTPNSTVAIWQQQAGGWVKLREPSVGLDPVSLAFQPGFGGVRLWVVNHISDSVTVLDTRSGKPLAITEVGDEPVSIALNAAGSHAFVVCQSGKLVVLNGTTFAIAGEIALPCNTPRAIAYDAARQRVYVAALHSGNNTTVVGKSIRFVFTDATTGEPGSVFAPILLAPSIFAPTASLFAGEPQLAPWPDISEGIASAGPLVPRIISDTNATWAAIVDAFADENGEPDPAAMAAWDAQILATFNLVSVNTDTIFREVIHDARQTVDHDVLAIDVSNPASPALSHIFGNVGDMLPAIALNPVTGALWVANVDARNTSRLEPALRGHNVEHEIVIIADPGNPASAIARVNLHAHIPNFNDAAAPNAAAKAGSLANPTAIAFSSDGTTAFVLSLGADRVGVLNGATGQPGGVINVGRGPRGIVADSANQRLFVLNRTDLTVSLVDLAVDALNAPTPGTVGSMLKVFNPEPAEIRNGRNFLYSAKFSNNYSSACATCHADGTLDHRAWDLGDPIGPMQSTPNLGVGPSACNTNVGNQNHPLKGPMVTLSLRGLDGHDPFHWRGDRPHFVDFNGAFDSLLGGSELPSQDMAAFDKFIRTLAYPPAPFRNRDNGFQNPIAENGGQIFMNSCNVCHMVASDGAAEQNCPNGDVGDLGFDLNGLALQIQEVTQLRQIQKKFDSDLYNGFGLLHHGTEEREDNGHPIKSFVATFFPGLVPVADDLIAFLDAWPTNVMPIVGLQALVTTNVPVGGPLPLIPDVNLMISQHFMTPSRCDVIVRHIGAAGSHGFVLVSPAGEQLMFRRDDNTLVSFADLFALAGPTAPLVFTATPPGSGVRLGIDQDWDGVPDALDPCPQGKNDGDMNGDGVLNNFDIDPFVLALVFPDQYAVQFPGIDRNCAGDVDFSGALNNFDIDVFVSKLLGQ